MRAREVGLRFNRNKLQLRSREVRYMGHIISAEGVEPNPDKIQAIIDMPNPTDVKGVQRLLGMVNYHLAFLPRFAELSRPLTRRTPTLTQTDFDETWQEGSPWQETSTCRGIFVAKGLPG